MDEPLNSQTPASDERMPTEIVSSGRRSFLRGGLATAPIVMTLASRPVLGQQACTSPSGMQSANLSNHNHTIPCAGANPLFWAANTSSWPTPYVGKTQTVAGGMVAMTTTTGTSGTTSAVVPATLYHSTTTGFNGSYFGGKSMAEVLQMGSTGKTGVGRYCAAALLNARDGRTPPLTEQMVRAMWNDFNLKGYYENGANVRWYAADIIAYIKTTISI